ncbi:protein kinase domain-containing protein [Frankia sp. Cas4]|uniref:protein kinase domain-containing protein n=1 Tax=Frankia sp. Cas4 TaxID=3073927 RepID=UPI002AD468CC|nr:protein kinase [Frankia sp. Cas4]
MAARIIRHGPWGGPGEEATAVYLRDHLGDEWTVVCGRQLVGGTNTRDSDFIVVGPNSVTVIEEKSWHGELLGTEERWYDRQTHKELGSPINQANGVARVLAGNIDRLLRRHRREPMRGAGGGHQDKQPHIVEYLVVLSSPDVRFDVADPRAADRVVRLVGCEQTLVQFDRSTATRIDLRPVRDRILAMIEGLPERPLRPTQLGNYRILGDIEPTPRGPRYVGEHRDGGIRILLTYQRQGLSAAELAESDRLILREYHAMQRLAPLGRVFAVDPYVGVNDDQIWVVPMHPPAPSQKTIRRRIVAGERPALAVFTEVAADAYAGLADMHAEGIAHRALHPSRIWLPDGANKVTFSELLIAKIANSGTIFDADEIDHLGRPYRAPECRVTAHAAGYPSDVYSLALCLLAWWELRQSDPPLVPDAPPSLPAKVRDVLSACLAQNPTDRPEARQAADLLLAHLREEKKRAVLPAPGARIDNNKYELVRRLGDGATATTWLMIDRRFEIYHTLKIMKSARLLDYLRSELTLLQKLKHDRIVGVSGYLLDPPGPALIAEYVDGRTVSELGATLRGNLAACQKILADMLDALEYAHHRDVLHRDISPNNIIVDTDDRATLIDFGVATSDADRSVVGTLSYQAPEIAAGLSWSPAADLYSLAVVCFEALTGRLPYLVDGAQFPNKWQLVRPADVEVGAVGDTGLFDVLLRACDPDPERRFASAAAFRDAVAHALAPPPPLPLPTRREDEPGVEKEQNQHGSRTERREPPHERKERSWVVNPAVDEIRQLFRNSRLGNRGNRGLDSDFAVRTYVPTRLDGRLVPRIVEGRPQLVVFSGNPGDGKTAFLERLGEFLRGRGARVRASDAAGWRMDLDGHEYASVYDASESHEGMSADDLLHRALDPVNDTHRAGGYTALIAANDGRLLDFLEREAPRYPQIAKVLAEGGGTDGSGAEGSGIVRVDLKGRSMASLGAAADSLTVRLLDALMTDDMWSACAACAAEQRCPIVRNARELGAQRAQDRLHRLVLTSHLRRGRRPTIRDLRSTLAYLVTADLGCVDIHREIGDGPGNPATPERHFSSLAFDASGGRDRLLDEWRELDPAAVAAARLERALAPDARTATDMARAKRRLYFTAPDPDLAGTGCLSPYRYLEEFRAVLATQHRGGGADGQNADQNAGRTGSRTGDVLARTLLRGLSRCIGPVGYDGDGVAVSVGEPAEDGGAVVKVLSLDEFEVTLTPVDDRFVETAAEVFVLRHISGQARMTVDIDLFELLMRAAAGYLPTNPEVMPLLEELGLFRSSLTLQPASKVIVIEPNGRRNAIAVTGATIELLGS